VTLEKHFAGRKFTYTTFLLSGWLRGKRVRRQFVSRDEALGEKNSLEVEAANLGGEIRARNTRLSADQLAEAEAAMARLGPQSLSLAVEWFLTTYRPPVETMALETAVAAFLAERAAHVRATALRDYRHTLGGLKAAFASRTVHSISTADIQGFLANRAVGKKRLNNLRGDLHAFFGFCQAAPREWTRENPVRAIPKFKISRSVPEIINADTAARLMSYLEAYSGAPRSELQPGCLVPYFALALFAGMRPSAPYGEIWKLAQLPDPSKCVNLALGVIRISPELAKTKSVRQIAIQSNLAAWLLRYPIAKYPLIPPNYSAMLAAIRKRFGLGADVLRHTFISMHIARFKSLGAAALEAGNSETMVRRHYLNLVSEADARAFWAIEPGASVGDVVEMQPD
jgi:hypothetical protein